MSPKVGKFYSTSRILSNKPDCKLYFFVDNRLDKLFLIKKYEYRREFHLTFLHVNTLNFVYDIIPSSIFGESYNERASETKLSTFL